MRTSINQKVTTSLLGLCLFTLPYCGANPDGGSDPKAQPAQPAAAIPDDTAQNPDALRPFFDENTILDFKLTFSDAEWARFQQLRAERDDETYVHCGFEALGQKFPDAACRSKGRPKSWAIEPKPQIAVRFNHWDPSGRFLGLRKVSLEANPYAIAPINDRLGMWVMRQHGVRASRVNHVRVFKNDTLLGLYMNIEVVDKTFLARQFADSTGNLYSQGYELETNTENPDYSRLEALNALIDLEPLTGDHTQFFAEIEKMVDIRVMLAETAAENVLPTGDNWSNGGDNFSYYDDPKSGKFVIMPWDLDTIIDPDYAPFNADPYAFWGTGVDGLIFAPNKLLELLYQKPEWRKEYTDNLVNIRDHAYSNLPAYIDQVCRQIRDAFDEDANKLFSVEEFDEECANHKARVTQRIAYLKQILQR